MTRATCKACGESLGTLPRQERTTEENEDGETVVSWETVEAGDFSSGDTVECPNCGSEFEFFEHDDERYQNLPLRMRNVPVETPTHAVDEWVEVIVADDRPDGGLGGTVTYLREDGVRVRDPVGEHDVPEGVPRRRIELDEQGRQVRVDAAEAEVNANE